MPEKEDDFDVEKSVLSSEESMRIHQIIHDLSEPYKEVFSFFRHTWICFLKQFGMNGFTYLKSIYRMVLDITELDHLNVYGESNF